jgi:hypothetical protein
MQVDPPPARTLTLVAQTCTDAGSALWQSGTPARCAAPVRKTLLTKPEPLLRASQVQYFDVYPASVLVAPAR